MVQTFLYALPARWYMASIVKTEFKGTTFAGAHLVPDAPPGSPAFACDPGTPSCYGYTGEQVTHQEKWDILWNKKWDRLCVECDKEGARANVWR